MDRQYGFRLFRDQLLGFIEVYIQRIRFDIAKTREGALPQYGVCRRDERKARAYNFIAAAYPQQHRGHLKGMSR